MVNRTLEFFKRLKKQIGETKADIKFLTQCKSARVVPHFINLKTNSTSHSSRTALNKAKYFWLTSEIKAKYAKLHRIEATAYNLHLKLSYEIEDWDNVYNDMLDHVNVQINSKIVKLNRKLDRLKSEQLIHHHNIEPLKDRNLVINKTDEIFSEGEMSLLNKGLKYNFANTKSDLEDIIAHIEKGISPLTEGEKRYVRDACFQQLNKNMEKCQPSKQDIEDAKNLKKLKSRPCYFLKPDKGSGIVIINKKDYIEKVENMLNTDDYVKLDNNPLEQMAEETKNLLKGCRSVFNYNDIKYKLVNSNPTIPRLYALPKIHKPGDKYRPIVSCLGSPSYNLSKWLNHEFKALKFDSFSVKNNLQLVNDLKDFTLKPTHRLVSFDVVSLFPSIPIEFTINYLRKVLEENNYNDEYVNELIELTELCMKHNTFRFNNKFYSQKQGTSMGNPLSPFVADFFMSYFETKIKKDFKDFPDFWRRYVDDILAIFDISKGNINEFLDKINSCFPSIKFTIEMENDGKLPFLDLLIIRNDNKIEFDIYRKETNTNQLIPPSSNHHYSHKMAYFHSSVHRLVSIPLTKPRFEKEKNFLKSVALSNGYKPCIIDELIQKKLIKLRCDSSQFTQLEPVRPKNNKRLLLPFNKKLCNNLSKIFKKVDLDLVYKPVNSLKRCLGTWKDKIDNHFKSGIYSFSCQECDKTYIGQTRRSLLIRADEHIKEYERKKNKNTENLNLNSSIASHLLQMDKVVTEKDKHEFPLQNLKLLKEVNEPFLLNAWESMFIHSYRKQNFNLLNKDNGRIPNSKLFDLL